MKKTNKAVVIIDMLEDFVYGSLKNGRARKIIKPIKQLINYAHKKGWLVIFSNDAHLPGDPEERVWGRHAMAGSPGAEVIKALKPKKGEVILPKRTYSAFFETGLDLLLRQHGVETVILTGQHTHICIRHTSADAFFRNYKIVIPKNAVESFSEEDHKSGLKYLKMCYGVKVTTVEALVSR